MRRPARPPPRPRARLPVAPARLPPLRFRTPVPPPLTSPPPFRGAGTDLTTLGLNLNSSDCLYATFASPWADSPAQRDPEFNLPQCYYMQPPALKTVTLTPTRGNPNPNQGLP